MLTKIIRNDDIVIHTWVGVEFSPGFSLTIPEEENSIWANDSGLIAAIAEGKAIVNDGTSDIADLNEAIVYLKSNTDTLAKDSDGRLLLSTPQRTDGKLTVHSSTRTIGDSTYFTSRFDKHVKKTLDPSEAVDKGQGLVGLPLTAHGLTTGDKIWIEGSSNYNAKYIVHSDTTANELVVEANYIAESFTGSEKVEIREVGEGGRMYLSLLSTDECKSIEGVFINDVHIKDGLIKFEGAPDGAEVSMLIIAPLGYPYYVDTVLGVPCTPENPNAMITLATEDTIISQFVYNCAIYKTNLIGEVFDSEDESTIPAGYKIRLHACNGDIGAAFKVWVRVEMFRAYTIL